MGVCGCGAEVPAESGPTHAYMQSLPACWRMYGALTVRLMAPGSGQPTHVDCYATQHPGGAEEDRRQRQSVAVHLVALCASVEHGVSGSALLRIRGDLSDRVLPIVGLADWPLLPPPSGFGAVTAPALYRMGDDELTTALAAWPESVWPAWTSHHDIVRGWTRIALAGRPTARRG